MPASLSDLNSRSVRSSLRGLVEISAAEWSSASFDAAFEKLSPRSVAVPLEKLGSAVVSRVGSSVVDGVVSGGRVVEIVLYSPVAAPRFFRSSDCLGAAPALVLSAGAPAPRPAAPLPAPAFLPRAAAPAVQLGLGF